MAQPNIEDYYDNDERLDEYERLMENRDTANHTLQNELEQHDIRIGSLLDVFAGTGLSTGAIREYQEPDSITVVDIAASALRRLQERHRTHPKLRIVQQDAGSYLYGGDLAMYDTVTAIHGLYFVPPEEQWRIITGMAARLHPGGHTLFSYDPIVPGSPEQHEPSTDYAQEGGGPITVYRLEPNAVTAWLRTIGMNVLDHDVLLPENSDYYRGFVVARKPTP